MGRPLRGAAILMNTRHFVKTLGVAVGAVATAPLALTKLSPVDPEYTCVMIDFVWKIDAQTGQLLGFDNQKQEWVVLGQYRAATKWRAS